VKALGFSVLSLLSLACSERTTNLVSRQPNHGFDGSVPAMDAALPFDARTPFVLSDAGVVYCGEAPCACSNGMDDDGDGLVDGFDGECTGPYDQDEATFATGEVKQGNPHCSDCFFDGNSPSNDDGCLVSVTCSEDGNAQNAIGACPSCEVSVACVNNCLPRTPNGCDCFGCCEVTTPRGKVNIQLVDTCSITELDDVGKCPRCIPAEDCQNPCGECELCPGKTLADLPASCANGGGPGFSCDEGDVCRSAGECPAGGYCGQGCCQPVVL
jgi:hypothetical protein